MSADFPAGLELREVDWTSVEATGLRDAMDADLRPRYADLLVAGKAPGPVDPDEILFCLVAFDGDSPVATAALKRTGTFFEIKRVFVAPSHRRLGVAGALLDAAENRARGRGVVELVLQTGFRQPEAMALYVRHGWHAIAPFGPYAGDLTLSRCFAKSLVPLLIGVELAGTGIDDLMAEAHSEAIARFDAAGADLVVVDDAFGAAESAPGRLDAPTLLGYSAFRTSSTALVPVVTTTHTEPFHVAKVIQTMDVATAGRAGWQVAVSTGDDAAARVGRRLAPDQADAWAEAEEAIEVAERLWDSWEEDAEIRDVSTGRFLDRDKVHHIDFAGRFFAVRGPSIVPRSPQGRPPIIIAVDGQSPAFPFVLDIAARRADVIRLRRGPAGEPADAALVMQVREAVQTAGRVGRVIVLSDFGVTPTGANADPPDVAQSVEALAGTLSTWRHNTGTDGIVLLVNLLDGGEDQAAAVERALRAVPRPATRPATFRDRLGLSRPVSRYSLSAASAHRLSGKA